MLPRESNLKIAVLVSIGLQPRSGRSRRADGDSRALELALNLNAGNLEVLHAGDPNAPALREYAGMGVPLIKVLAQSEDADVVPVLGHYLGSSDAQIVMTGRRAESGEGSGMVPYLLASRLGWPLVGQVVAITPLDDHRVEVLQALPRGQRRKLEVALPFVACVDPVAPSPRQSAFGPGQRAQIEVINSGETEDKARLGWQILPARAKPARIKTVKATSAADRFLAATARTQQSGNRVISDGSVQEKAKAVFDLLKEEGVLN